MMNIFEKATKEKIRFEHKGLLSTEDLWNLDVEELDSIFKKLNAEKRSANEDSLLETKTKENVLLNTKIKIVTHIVEYKLALQEARLRTAEIKEKREKIMEILANKEDDALVKKTPAQLKKMLEEISTEPESEL